MNIDDMTMKSYLEELHRLTGGDTDVQVSMYDTGAALGLEKQASGRMAEELMVLGQVELKTLSGGIGITEQGLNLLGVTAPQKNHGQATALSAGPVINDLDRATIETLLGQLKDDISHATIEYPQVEEIIFDIKTIEVQLLSPRPKVALINEGFRSIHDLLASKSLKLSVGDSLTSLVAQI
jgi:hypothetical protein